MTTQLRVVPTFGPSIGQIAYGLDQIRADLFTALPESEEIDFSFGPRGLRVEIKTNKRELRDAILFKIKSGIDDVQFDKIVEGVETGARRRLTVTAEVQ